MSNPHDEAVFAFFKQCQQEDPERYQEISQRYPMVSANRIRRLRRRERCVGLLGLQPCDLPQEIAIRNNLDQAIDESS